VSPFWCSSCHQVFAQDGFCPYDGVRLATPPAAAPQPATVRSASASDGDHRAALDALSANPGNDYDRLIGQTLDGRYYIERKIGEGGMGVVFAARHTIIEKPLAVKVLKREVARDPATIKRFVQEAKAATRIGHPAIVDVTDFGTTPDGMTYSVMEYVDGQTLSQVLKKNAPLPLNRAVPIVAQLGRALGVAHDKGIVHRDLKPENVFLVNRETRRDFVKIVDFGIAKVTPVEGQAGDGPRLTRAGSVFGTPEYMAPEQAAGRPDTDQRVDVYALATILYEMLTGRVPHKGENMVRTLAMQMLEPIDPPSAARPDLPISVELERVVMKGLAKSRDERYPNMADFVTDLERACPGIPTGVPAPSAGGPSGPLQLVPAPPGADPAVLSGQRTVADAAARTPPPVGGPDAITQRPRGKSAPGVRGPATEDLPTQRRIAHEPRFVTSERPHTFDHVFDDAGAERRRRGSRWAVVVVLVVIATAGGVAAALVLGGRSAPAVADQGEDSPAAVDAAIRLTAVDAGTPAADAMVIAEVPVDAGRPVDAGGTRPRRDGGVPRKIDAGVPREHLTPRGTVQVQVLSKPDGATIYVGDSYRGVSGVTLEESPGTRVKVRCTLPGHDPGHVDVVFDGRREIVMCRPQRAKRCVDELHNPFDDCPDPKAPD
jgi:tRNA A-37 threonylcarbamoyl transferase component Bud32